MIHKDISWLSFIDSWYNKKLSHCDSYRMFAWLISDITTWLVIRHLLGGKTAKGYMKEGLNTGEVSVFLCVLSASLSVFIFVCTAVAWKWIQRGGGGLYQEGGMALPRSIWHKGAYSYYACWWYLWEIRSGPANETQGKGLHRNPLFNFNILKFFNSHPPSTTWPPVFAFIWTHTISSYLATLQHFHEWKWK